MHPAYPFHIASSGLAATVGEEEHIKELIEQLLFTTPGERVNRPDFGTPFKQLVFQPTSAEMVTAVQFMIQGALQQWLGELIQVQAVQVITDDATLTVTIQYAIRQTQQTRVAQFSR